MLDINNFSNLNDAWNAQCEVNIEDFNCREVAESFFTDPEHSPTKNIKCLKETWIKELPKVLLYSINRVNYDVKQKKLVKNIKRFEFDKILYADKFMY